MHRLMQSGPPHMATDILLSAFRAASSVLMEEVVKAVRREVVEAKEALLSAQMKERQSVFEMQEAQAQAQVSKEEREAAIRKLKAEEARANLLKEEVDAVGTQAHATEERLQKVIKLLLEQLKQVHWKMDTITGSNEILELTEIFELIRGVTDIMVKAIKQSKKRHAYQAPIRGHTSSD